MNKENNIETGDTHTVLKINMSDNKLSIMMCPALILANKRTIKAKGFVNIPIISIGIIMGNKSGGTPGVAKICFQ